MTMCVIIIMVNSMNTRMERYNSENTLEDNVSTESPRLSRVSRNNSLYQDIKSNELSRVRSNDNIKVIESNGKTIDLDKIKRYITEVNEQPSVRRKSVRIEEDVIDIKDEENVNKAPKDYDINLVLEKAKRTREIDYDSERYKKLRDTQFDILNKINMYDSKEDELIDNLEENFNTEEKTLIDLINTVTIHKGDINLLEELVGDGSETTEPIEKEIEKGDIKKEIEEKKEEKKEEIKEVKPLSSKVKSKTEKIDVQDNSFYTNSMTFGKEDFEGFDELEKSVKKNSVFSTIMIVVLILFIIVTLVIIANYVFELGLF